VARDRLDLSRVIEAVEQGWRGRLGARGRPLRFELEGGLPPVQASEAAVLQILHVLVGNAAEHGSGTVTVRARAAPGGLAIEVADEGAGVAGDPEQVFARRAGSAAGHGIGLALARSLAEAEGGRLLLQRPEPEPVFAVLLPAGRASELADATLN
jgi:signal transduction histidine kinase